MKLWTPQIEAVSATLADIDSFPRGSGVLYMATGMGKTVVAAETAKCKNEPVWFLAHREELIFQAQEKFAEIWPEATQGLVYDNSNTIGKVTIASIAALRFRPDMLAEMGKSPLVITDEVHRAVSPSWRSVLKHVTGYSLGLTATPGRHDGIGLKSQFDKILYTYTLVDGVRDGYLCDLIGKVFPLESLDLDVALVGPRRFNLSKLSRLMRQPHIVSQVVDRWLQNAPDRKTVAFCVDIQHAHDLAMEFCRRGIACTYVSGEPHMRKSDRRQRIHDFARDRYQVICNAQLLREGWDEKTVNCLLMTNPTHSVPGYLQDVGRGARGGKPDCWVMDFVGNCRHELVQLSSLLGKAPRGKRVVGVGNGLKPVIQDSFSLREHIMEAQTIELVRKKEWDAAWVRVPIGLKDEDHVLQISPDMYAVISESIVGKAIHISIWARSGYKCSSYRIPNAATTVDEAKMIAQQYIESHFGLNPRVHFQVNVVEQYRQLLNGFCLAINTPDGREYIRKIKQCKSDGRLDCRITYAEIDQLTLYGCQVILKKYITKGAV